MRSNLVDGDSQTKLFENLEDGPQAAATPSSSENSELYALRSAAEDCALQGSRGGRLSCRLLGTSCVIGAQVLRSGNVRCWFRERGSVDLARRGPVTGTPLPEEQRGLPRLDRAAWGCQKIASWTPGLLRSAVHFARCLGLAQSDDSLPPLF
jgi:hypothetical protein